MRFIVFSVFASANVLAQEVSTVVPDPSEAIVYVCPDDESARSTVPASCPDSDTAMIPAIPDPVEYHLDLAIVPQPLSPGQESLLRFRIRDPWSMRATTRFYVVHEKLLHAFLVSEDLEVFMHEHPVWRDDAFYLDVNLPRAGMYRVLADFYPEAATPQLLEGTVFVTGSTPATDLISRDYTPKESENVTVEFSTIPERPIAGAPTQLLFWLAPGEGLEEYLGAWAHALVASDDLIDLMHVHSFLADGSQQVQFPVVFPRSRSYRVWAQFQRDGVVNTVHFDVTVVPPIAAESLD